MIQDLFRDLADESNDLEKLIVGLAAEQWRMPTPAPGWSIAHQIAHLGWAHETALLAAVDPERFQHEVYAPTVAHPNGFNLLVESETRAWADASPDVLLTRWKNNRDRLGSALAAAEPGRKLPWFGRTMSTATTATALLTETWAHGQDVADALGVARPPTARLRHVAWLGLRTRDFAFLSHGLAVPDGEFHVELTAPDGGLWEFGPGDATERVTGSAIDFCLLVTQRRHRADLDLWSEGPDASRWLEIAQAFAGPPGPGRQKGQFA